MRVGNLRVLGSLNNVWQRVYSARIAPTIDFMEYSSDANAQAAYVSNGAGSGITATGGTVTTVGTEKVHTFTSDETFTVTGSGTVKVLVVAGGGGGGDCSLNSGADAGGGGAGGYIYNSSFAVTGQAYSITVGGGGAGAGNKTGYAGTGGSNSVFSSLTAVGGGGGAGSDTIGGNGGSGGGASGAYTSHGTGTSQQGYDGGEGLAGNGYPGGGGGGAGAVGQNAPFNQGGNGGVGLSNTILDDSTDWYAGGGGGACETSTGGTGGSSVGGAGSTTSAAGGNGVANTGGGGGGGSTHDSSYGGNGGSGIVIIRYTPNYYQSYSEATIKTQGSYALKAVAAITDSLNKTLTKTFASPLDLSGINTLKLDMRASRTGANVKLGLHDTGGTTTELTPTISSADTYETKTWDISGVANADKNAIDKLIFTPTNADAANTVYFDNFYIDGASIFGAQTSLTISGLDGDTDVEYMLKARIVNGYNGGTYYDVRPNNDSGTNYGRQQITGQVTGIAAYRGTRTGLVIGYADALYYLNTAELLLYAKSGYVRTALNNYARGISGTTVTFLAAVGQSWNNTTDNITSLVILSDQTNGLGIGTQIDLFRRIT